MTYVPLGEILRPCVGEPWALGAFDTANLEITQAIVDAAVAESSPLIIMLYPGHVPQRDWPGVLATIAAECQRATVPVALQMDHCKTLDQVAWGIRLGFSGVMIDGSVLPFEQNLELTRRAVEMCHRVGVGVEAELGHVGDDGEQVSADVMQARLTRSEEAVRFVEQTGVDALAVAIGTVHGLYRGRPELDFERIAALRAALDVPLVVHGGSDTPDPDMCRAIRLGVDKINIWTDMRVAYLRAVKQVVDTTPLETCSVEAVTEAARASVREIVCQKMRLFGSSGKA